MNVEQMIISARNLLMAGSASNTNIVNDPFWNDTQLLQLLNQAERELRKVVRRSNRDYFTRILRTTAAALTIFGETFTPSTLAWVSGTGQYTLPPDFVRLLQLTDLTASGGADRIIIRMEDLNREAFREVMNETAQSQSTGEYYAQIIGARTLLIRPIPGMVRDWEFIYERRLEPLRRRETGTASVNNNATAVTFSSTALANRFMRAGGELIFSTGAARPTADPSEIYSRIETVDSATAATLEGPWYTTDAANLSDVAYIYADVSEIPSEHHDCLVYYCVKEAFKMGPNANLKASLSYEGMYADQKQDLIGEVESRQTMDPEFVTPYLEDAAVEYRS